MDHIKQLKQIRADAIARMRQSPDFKLAGKLGLLIVELGEELDDSVDFEDKEPARPLSSIIPSAPAAATATTPLPFTTSFSRPRSDTFADLTSDEMINELVAEIEGDAAELDALMAEEDHDAVPGHIGPFAKTVEADVHKGNGAAH